MQDVRDYLNGLLQARAHGVPETAGYPALKALFDAVGARLNPKITLVVHPRGDGSALPDGGLFELRRGRRHGQGGLFTDDQTLPDRGAVEVKAPDADVEAVAASEQGLKYLRQYGHLLVTNYWDFALFRLAGGRPETVDRHRIADSADQFWARAGSAQETARARGPAFVEFLTRVCLTGVPLDRPKAVAQHLASYAREALAGVEAASEVQELAAVRTALESALGISFDEEQGRHFFHSTLVQTVFYGLFSGWVLWSQDPAPRGGEYRVETTYRYLRLPMIEPLFRSLMGHQLRALGFEDLLERAAGVLNRVDRGPFFSAFEEAGAVQYFYEPFLEAFDPELRKQMGVWYTPVEIVRYQVGRVDRLLRTELGVADGLADPNVVVLDPCCGTGAYLAEALALIGKRLTERHGPALAPSLLKTAAVDRLFGFELLPAPYVVAHLQIGMALAKAGAGLLPGERAAVYLTNALTGWEPRNEPQAALDLFQFRAERDAALGIKRERPILVILGNPPYNGFAGITESDEERALTDAYRAVERAPAPTGQGLNDLYVRFFRMAERRITEGQPGHGVVCFISNYSWLDSLSCPGMREAYLHKFDQVWIDNMNGDRYATGKRTPTGKPDPSVFSTPGDPVGIQVGTAIATLVRRPGHVPPGHPASTSRLASGVVRYRDLWGTTKNRDLLASLDDPDLDARYQTLAPEARLGFPFKPRAVSGAYLAWPTLPELLPTSFPGVQTSRDDFLVDIDRDRLEARIARYFDPRVSDEALARLHPEVMEPSRRFDPVAARRALLARGPHPGGIRPYHYRPFDVRWLYWDPDTKLLDEKRAEYVQHVRAEYPSMALAKDNRRGFDPPTVCGLTGCRHVVERGANFYPLRLVPPPIDQRTTEEGDEAAAFRATWNLSDRAWAGLEALGIDDPSVVFYHALATLHSPAYRRANAGALRQDWPRVPWPEAPSPVRSAPAPAGEAGSGPPSRGASPGAAGEGAGGGALGPGLRAALEASAELGRRVAALLDPDTPVPGVTAGAIGPALSSVAVFETVDGGPPRPEDFALTVRWGYRGQGGAVMPGPGRVTESDGLASDRPDEAPAPGATRAEPHRQTPRGPCPDPDSGPLLTVHLNDRAAWTGVPRAVWEYQLGGYQVLKKWLSYRERDILGRPLRPEEVGRFTDTARRIAALLALGPELDAAHEAVCAACRVQEP